MASKFGVELNKSKKPGAKKIGKLNIGNKFSEEPHEQKPQLKKVIKKQPETKKPVHLEKKAVVKKEPEVKTKAPVVSPEPVPEVKPQPEPVPEVKPQPEPVPEVKLPEPVPEVVVPSVAQPEPVQIEAPKQETKAEPQQVEQQAEQKPVVEAKPSVEKPAEVKPAPTTEEKPKPQPEIKQEQQKAKPAAKDAKVSAVKEQPKVGKDALKPVPKDKVVPKEKPQAVKVPTEQKPKQSAVSKDILEAEAAVKAAQVAEAALPQPKRRRPQYKPIPEEFFDRLFYFSGMGTVVGSAINEGVYVPTRSSKTALGTEVIEEIEQEKEKEREQDIYMIKNARKQAFDIAEELRKLQLLLGGMPNFGENESLHKIDRKPIDTVMHAHYFQPDQPAAPDRKHGVQVTLQSRAINPPKVPQSQWPPPLIAPKPVKEEPVKVDSSAKAHAAPAFNVHKIVPSQSSVPWQQRFGTKSSADDIRVPQPYGEGEIPSGLKPWELSRLRGMEARGYQFEHQEPLSGADYSDSFYHGDSNQEMFKTDISSLAPFLVSGRSQSVDRVEKLHHTQPGQKAKHDLFQGAVISPRPYTLGQKVPSFHGSQASLPFSDL